MRNDTQHEVHDRELLGLRLLIPISDRWESRRPDAGSALARQGGATTYRIDMEME